MGFSVSPCRSFAKSPVACLVRDKCLFFFLFCFFLCFPIKKKGEKSSPYPRMSGTYRGKNFRIRRKKLQERCHRNDFTVEKHRAKRCRFVEIRMLPVAKTNVANVACRQNPLESSIISFCCL